MEDIKNALPGIWSKLDQFQLKDIYNMDEIGLFYRLESDHSLAMKQLEGRKKDNDRITVAICYNRDGFDKEPLWIIGIIRAFKVHYRRRFYSNILQSLEVGSPNIEN